MPETQGNEKYLSDYMKRLKDLENPLPTDSPFFLPPRQGSSNQSEYKTTPVLKMPKAMTEEEKQSLRQEYFDCLDKPATVTEDTFDSDTVTEVLDGRGWVIPNILSEAECEEFIKAGEDWGIGEEDTKVAEDKRLRTSNRTTSYQNPEWSIRLNKRLPEDFLVAVEKSSPYTSVRGIHPNWRVARYK